VRQLRRRSAQVATRDIAPHNAAHGSPLRSISARNTFLVETIHFARGGNFADAVRSWAPVFSLCSLGGCGASA
jgi:hypothetical protein